MRSDVVVVGAGPAGATAALQLARSGARVLLLDRAAFPRWKVCGGCVGPAASRLLERLGLRHGAEAAGAQPLDTMRLSAGTAQAVLRLGDSLALSRSALDGLLAGAAREAGAEVRFGVRVESVRDGGGFVELVVREEGVARRVRASVVVDATGLGPLGLDGERADETVAPRSRVGIGAVYGAGMAGAERLGGARAPRATPTDPRPPVGELRMVAGRHGYVGMVRVEDGRLNVAAAVDLESLAAEGPEGVVAEILAEAGHALPEGAPEEGWRGTPPLTRRPARVARGRVLRVGDAAGYVEPFTGEGIGWAMVGGVAVTPAVRRILVNGSEAVDGAGRAWGRAHGRLVRRRQRICRMLTAGIRRPRLVRAAVGILARAPRLAAPVVRVTERDLGVPHGWLREAPQPSVSPGGPLGSRASA